MKTIFSKKQLHFSSHMGRMGNQMFQYACARHLELKHGYICSLDDLSKLSFFKLAPGEHKKNAGKLKLFFHIAKRLWGADICNLHFDDMHNSYVSWLTNIKKPTMIWAFFQSEAYFKDSAKEIRSYFEFKEEYSQAFDYYLAGLNLKKGAYNAVHLRRTDYKGFTVKGLKGDDFTLPMSYYNRALSLLDSGLPTLFISDDAAFCRQEFGHIPDVLFSDADAAVDFQLLSNARNTVISNSTFAWWAAWLNPGADKKIFCPKYFLGFKENKEVPVNIYPESWTQVEVL